MRDLAKAQDLAQAMLNYQRQKQDPRDTADTEQPPQVYNYSFKFEQPLTPQPEPIQPTEPQRDHITEKQDLAAAMIDYVRQCERAEPETIVQQAQETARELATPRPDDQPQKYINPITGKEMTADAYQQLQARIEEQKQREAERQIRDRERKHHHRR